MNDNILDPLNAKPSPTDYIAELTGPGKKFDRSKYASEAEMWQAVSKGKYESDSYVGILETRSDQMREDALQWKKEADSRANLEELLDQMKKQPVTSNTPPANTEITKPTIDPNQIQSLVSSEVQKLRASEKETSNYSLVLNKAKERYGENFANALKLQAVELNLSDDYVNTLARTQPQLFMKTFGLEAQQAPRQSFQAPPSSAARTDTFRPQTQEVRDWNYYQKLKQEMGPKFYYDKKLAVQMHQDAMELGDRFKTGDFDVPDKELMQRLDTYTHSIIRNK